MMFVVIFAVFAVCLQSGESLLCYPCENVQCVPVESLYCAKGAELVKDRCNCCDVCSKGYGEPCGGDEKMGACSQVLGLVCKGPTPCKDPHDSECTSKSGKCGYQ